MSCLTTPYQHKDGYMGSSNSSRRRRMSNSVDLSNEPRAGHTERHRERRENADAEELDVGNDSDSEHHDLPSILAYLIRSGQVRILTSSDRGDSFSDDEDEGYFEKTRPPMVDPNPDTTQIKKNDIYQEILLKSGRSRVQEKCHPTVTHMMYKREVGMNKRLNFSPAHQRVMCTPYLPNHYSRMAYYRQKAFCGTYSVDGNIFLSAAQDQHIRIYNTEDNKFDLIKTIRAKDVGWSVLDTAFSPDGNYMIYSSWSECIHLCNVYGDGDIHTALHLFPEEGSFCIFSLTFSSDNREILGGANDGHLYVYDRESNQRTLKIDAHDDDVNAVAFADNTSQILFSGGDDGLCKVWDRRTLKEEHPLPVGTLAGHYDGITYIDPKGDARYLLSNSKDQTMKLWDIRIMSSNAAVERTKKAVSKQRWDYRWQQVPKNLCKKNKLEGDTSVMTYKGHSVLHTLIRCHFSPEFTTGQRYVYTGCSTGSLVIYDTLSGNIVRRLEGHRSCVRDVSWHPYENNIMTSSWDGCVGKWEYITPDLFEDDGCGGDSTTSDTDEDRDMCRRRSARLHKKRRCRKGTQHDGCPKRGLFD